MNTPNDCQAFVVHLQDEHRRLDEAAHKVEELLASRLKNRPRLADTKDAANQLRRLRERLNRHFQEEEEGGCIEEAVARCPTLSQDAFDLEREHRELLGELDQLIVAAEREQPLAKLDERYHVFVGRLRAHEAQENELVQRGFNVQFVE